MVVMPMIATAQAHTLTTSNTAIMLVKTYAETSTVPIALM